MCTLSIIPTPRGYRVACNRDESRGRPEAAPPRWRTLDAPRCRAVWPTDTLAGGTWIGAAAHGLTLALLNASPGDAPAGEPGRATLLSRGLVIPAVISQPDAPSAARALERLALDRFAPFRLIAIDAGAPRAPGSVIECRWDRRAVTVRHHPAAAACFASSGLGDELVQCRVALFHAMVSATDPTPEAQDLFHAHRWDDRPEVSVLMSRDEARTVSVTVVEFDAAQGPAKVRMQYAPVTERSAVPATA